MLITQSATGPESVSAISPALRQPTGLAALHYKRDRALCHRDGVKVTPSLDHCVPGCGNIIRTDHHAALLHERADLFDTRAAHAAGPLGERLRASAAKLRSHANTHHITRTTLAEDAG